jgi:hypothetical protein
MCVHVYARVGGGGVKQVGGTSTRKQARKTDGREVREILVFLVLGERWKALIILFLAVVLVAAVLWRQIRKQCGCSVLCRTVNSFGRISSVSVRQLGLRKSF